MPDPSPNPKPKAKGLIKVEEWIAFMRRTLRVIDKHLKILEERANLAGPNGEARQRDGKKFEHADIRALQALTNTLKTVRVVHEDIREEKLSEDAKQQLRESRAEQEELERRLDRLAECGDEK